MNFIDYYKVLNINYSYSIENIKKSFRNHPDITQNNELKTEKFRLIQEAYSILSNPEKRKAYDSTYFLFNPRSKEVLFENTLVDVERLKEYLKHITPSSVNYDNVFLN